MELVNIQYSGFGKSFQDLSRADKDLVTSNYINSIFGNSSDYIELYVYDESGNLIESDYGFSNFTPTSLVNSKNGTYSAISLNPEKDAKDRGYNRGEVTLQYNFYKNLFNSAYESRYWIKEISRSRTELKLTSQVISDSSIQNGFDGYRAYISTKNYYPEFYLNFEDNQLVIANNVALTSDESGVYLLIKLYEPLPDQFDIKSTLWMVDKIAESVSYRVNIEVETEETNLDNRLRGPNYNVQINNKTGQTTQYYTYNNLISNAGSSSFQKLSSWYQDKAISINVDYSDFSNFVHFSSAVQRVNNFVYKLQLIESSSLSIISQGLIVSGGSIASSSITAEQAVIDNIIKNFDTYEYYLYFESSSWAWPKSNSTQPYSLCSVTSSEARNFIGSETTSPSPATASLLFSASYYDSNNKDLLHNSIPQYLIEDENNLPFIVFLDMIGQHFDNIWIYYKDVTNRFNATNNPNTGISLDMISDALKGLGFQLFTNTNVSDNLYYTLFGINPDGSLLPPTGSELITKYVTSSIATLPAETIQDEIYKRLYHNLPYLYKTKGTARGIKSLTNIYGIPQEILTVKEFGGQPSGSLKGIFDLDSQDYKVSIITGSNGNVTGSLTISSSLLSPYTTIQYYEGKNRLNNYNIEVGFSPADAINNNISSSLTTLNVDQLIGSPSEMYSSSYGSLVSASNAYFANYTQKNSVWEYVRLLKFYNNSLFKTIKEFVPARANVSTGIIIKSHMLERNKYARHEPVITFNDFSQSINIGEISAYSGGSISGSTNWSGFINTPLGLAAFSSSKNVEKINGELSGSNILVTNGDAMEQGDYQSRTTGSVEFFNFGALHQNITSSVTSKILLDLDYSSNQIVPVNYNAVTYSISRSTVDNYETYTNKNNPFAQVQDYNYNLNRSLIPKYSGSKTISLTYNDYTIGDQSYGKTAAIDKIKYQYAYIVNIFSSSFQLPGRAKGQVKYLIDNDQNVINLSKTNNNLFSVQNIFKAGEWADVSLFDYDPDNPYIVKLNNDEQDFTVWESGYSYSPMLYNISASSKLLFSRFVPSGSEETTSTPGDTVNITSADPDYWISDSPAAAVITQGPPGFQSVQAYFVTASNSTKVTSLTCKITNNSGKTPGYIYLDTQIPAGITAHTATTQTGFGANWQIGDSLSVSIEARTYQTAPTSTTSIVYYVTASDSSPYLDAKSKRQIVLSATQSALYQNITQISTSSQMDIAVFPLDINRMDMIRLYNEGAGFSGSISEYRVISIVQTEYSSSYRIGLNLDRDIQGTDTDTRSIPGRISRYMILKRLPDETSVIFNYDLPQPIPEDGTLFPQYVGEDIKNNSGNVIKALKQQNLI